MFVFVNPHYLWECLCGRRTSLIWFNKIICHISLFNQSWVVLCWILKYRVGYRIKINKTSRSNIKSKTWMNPDSVDLVQPLLFSLNWRTREVVELCLCGSATSRYSLNLVLRFYCDACGRSFLTDGMLQTHISIVHSVRPTDFRKIFPCPFCNKRFTFRPNVRKHAKLVHRKPIEQGQLKDVYA